MTGPRQFKVATWAASELDLQREVMDLEDDPDVLAALRCWDGKTFTVAGDADLDAIHRGLVVLANACDSYAEHDKHPETRNHNRWARDGLSGLSLRLLRRGAA